MRIIIEGADGTGKTTLAKQLADEFDLGLMHISNKDPNDLDFYYQLLRKDDVVYDRNLIGEMIYPKIFNRPGKLKEYELDYLMAKADDLGFKIFVLTAHDETLLNRLNRKEEFNCVKDNISAINGDFLKYAGKYNLPVINTSKYGMDETFKEVKNCITRLN